MVKDTLLALAERCEEATGPDRELDRDICCAVQDCAGRPVPALLPGAFTASLDAAMTLVDLEVGADGNGHAAFPYLFRKSRDYGRTLRWGCWIMQTPNRVMAEAATPALALCAAALRALATTEKGSTNE